MKDIKTLIENLLRKTERPGIESLLDYMDNAGFYTAPCSSKYHLSQPGGLAEHSLNVFKVALKILPQICGNMKFSFVESVTICALLHDLGKAGQYGKPAYIENEDPEKVPFRANKELLYIPHEIRSVAIASRFIELTEEEQFAITYHNGLYGELRSIKGNETPLYMILHFADMWASRVTEREDEK